MYSQDDINEFLTDFLEHNEFNVLSFTRYEDDPKWNIEIEQYTPLGEDWITDIWFDGSVKDFCHAVFGVYDSFDVDEAASLWIEGRGENGVPSSVQALLDDAKWKEQTLNNLSKASNVLEKRLDFLMTPLKDDKTDKGGISHSGERLWEFLRETDTSYDALLKEINDSLKVCGIKPVKENKDIER